jgi:hypothetical protein
MKEYVDVISYISSNLDLIYILHRTTLLPCRKQLSEHIISQDKSYNGTKLGQYYGTGI